MHQLQIDLVQKSWNKIVPMKASIAAAFYAKLFELDPALQSLFKENLVEQGEKLMQMANTVVGELSEWDDLVPFIQVIGVKLAKYGIEEKDYETVGKALIGTLTKILGADFTEDVKAAWIAVYAILASTMKQAATELTIH